MRLALEIAEAVRGEWPQDRPLSFRLSCVDGMDGGWEMEDTVVLARELVHRGVDVIDCSSRGIRGATSLANLEATRRPARAGYQVPYAEELRRKTGIPAMAVGLIITPRQAERILERGQADLVLLAREALYDPHWVLHAARELEPRLGLETLAAVVGLVARPARAHRRRIRRLSGPARLRRAARRWRNCGWAALGLTARRGLTDADLGSGVIKQRIARKGRGRSGGFRAILLFPRDVLAFFFYGFAKGNRENLRRDELEAFQILADEMLDLTWAGLAAPLANGPLGSGLSLVIRY